MRVVITGASGFIGRRLCSELLERGHTIFSIGRTNIFANTEKSDLYSHARYLMGDFLPNEVISFEPEVLVHLAWDGIPDFSEEKCTDNLRSQILFFKQVENFKQLKKIICAGTCREYGLKKGPCIESDSINPDNYFSWAKHAIFQYLRILCQQRRLALVWFRIFFVYGPGQRNESLIPTLIRGYALNQEPDIKKPSAANDFIYIDDVVNAFISAIENQNNSEIFNLGSGILVRVSKIADMVKRVIQYDDLPLKKNPYTRRDDGLENFGMYADISLTSRELAWVPKITLLEGVLRTIHTAQHES
jgi:UDP-glucose 4-epimerase